MKILLSGGLGFVGSHVSHQLVNEGHTVHIVDMGRYYMPVESDDFVRNQIYKQKLRHGVDKTFNFSVLETSQLLNLLNSENYDTVVHLAASPLATTAMHNPSDAFKEISFGTQSVCEAIRLHGCNNRCKLVLISSSMAYGDFQNGLAEEDHICHPKDMYGSFKYISEIIVRSYVQNFNLQSAIVRPSAVYGPGDNNRRVIQSLLINGLRKGRIQVVEPDETMLDFTYVTELANAVSKVAVSEIKNLEIYNATRGNARTLRDVVNIISQFFPDLEVEEISNKETFRPKRGTLSNLKIKNHLDVKFSIDLEEGIRKYWEYMNE
jgi:nucleoside-diphosphate-sugar epimerase